MSDNKFLGYLSAMAVLVVFMTGVTWYHNRLYDNESVYAKTGKPATQTNPMPMKEDPKPPAPGNNTAKSADQSATAANTSKNIDLSAQIASLQLAKDKQDKLDELIQNLLAETRQTYQNMNDLLFPASGAGSDAAAKIQVLQRDFGVKYQQFQLDLSDLIGDKPAEQITAAIQGYLPPVLLQNNEPPSAGDGMAGMNM